MLELCWGVPRCQICLRLSIGHLCGLLPLAKVVEVMLTPLETFLFYFTLLSFALIFPPSLTAHVQYQADDKVELLLTLKQGSSSLDLELPVP